MLAREFFSNECFTGRCKCLLISGSILIAWRHDLVNSIRQISILRTALFSTAKFLRRWLIMAQCSPVSIMVPSTVFVGASRLVTNGDAGRFRNPLILSRL